MPLGQPPLADTQIAVIARWIDGLRPEGTPVNSRTWPFTKLERPAVPPVRDRHFVRNPVDAFVLAQIERAGIRPAPVVSGRVLLRRLYFDLIGLPPTPADLDRVLSGPDAGYEREIERLLGDPRYGERWGRHWLDVVRYADSTGGGGDVPLHHMWRYRDYVIRTFQQDRPYDRFIREQLAGDAYPAYGAEGRIGTGFLRLGVVSEGSTEEVRRELLTDLVSTTGAVFLGLTVGCARCHDHKFDPIPTRDYYRLEAFFAPVTIRADAAGFLPHEQGLRLAERAKQAEETLARRREALEKKREEYRQRLASAVWLTSPQDPKDLAPPVSTGEVADAVKKGLLFTQDEQEVLDRLERSQNAASGSNPPERYKPLAYVAVESLGSGAGSGPNYPLPPATFVLKGGNSRLLGERVDPGFLSAVAGGAESLDLEGIGSRRKLLAEWIASPDNPLTARVMVNRIWQHHFGEGLTSTPNDFGKNGSGPAHRDLLDWLAVEFIESGWSIKHVHRLILQSNVYRLSLNHPDAAEFEKRDPDGRWLWRRKPIRLEGEAIRDSMLAISGELDPANYGPPFLPDLDADTLRSAPWWEPSPREEQNRRSVYMIQRRGLTAPFLQVFDGANINESCAMRGVTTVTPQVFALMNSRFAQQQAEALSRRIAREAGDSPDMQIDRGYELVLQRRPTEFEKTRNRAFLAGGSLREFCLVLFNLSEFISLE
jgi:hypothetical protein